MHLRLIFIRFSMIYKMNKVSNPHPIKVSVPGSKSITNRALLIAALADGRSQLEGVLFSDDSRHFVQALIDLGFPVDVDEDKKEITITGCDGRIPCVSNNNEIATANGLVNASIHVGSAGTAARFLTAFLGLSSGRFRIDSSEQMKKRPMKELLIALETLGAEVIYEEEEYHFPFIIGNSKEIRRSDITIDVDKSSQFLSALLISSVLFTEDFLIKVTGHHGMAYVDMTIQMMDQFGAKVIPVEPMEGDTAWFLIKSQEKYLSLDYDIEPDLSAACYFYAMSPLLKVPSIVKGVPKKSLQGDMAFLDVLRDMGCEISEVEQEICVLPPVDGKIKGGSWDLSSFSDQALTLAAIAPFAQSEVFIRNVEHIRLQECDRIHGILKNLNSLGIAADEKDGNIRIVPGELHGGMIETFEDHRVAMAFSLPGLVVEGVEIENPQCCRKTFENYFELIEESLY